MFSILPEVPAALLLDLMLDGTVQRSCPGQLGGRAPGTAEGTEHMEQVQLGHGMVMGPQTRGVSKDITQGPEACPLARNVNKWVKSCFSKFYPIPQKLEGNLW